MISLFTLVGVVFLLRKSSRESGIGVDNLLLESGTSDHFLLESGTSDVLILE